MASEIDLESLDVADQRAILAAIEATLPSGPGQRNKQIFQFARKLKGIPVLANVNPACLRPLVNAWHLRAEPFMSGEHSVENTFVEFLYGWPRVRDPGGLDLLALTQQVLANPPHPACAQLGFKKPHIIVTIGLCAEMQANAREECTERQGGGHKKCFHLSTRKLAALLTEAMGLPISQTESQKTLQALVAVGVLDVVVKGKVGRATRFRFIWTPGPSPSQKLPDWLK